MKKFIAGVVMTGLMFMALATGAMAARNSSGSGQVNGGKSCTSYEYVYDTGNCYGYGSKW